MKKIGILGIGKLGLCFALHLEKAGIEVIGVDKDEAYVKSINDKTFRSTEAQVNKYLNGARNLLVTTDIARAIRDDIDLIFIFVSTPSTPEGGYDHYQIETVTNQLILAGKRNKAVHLVVGCTTMPGFCDKLAAKLTPYNYHVSYNPEFIAQGSIMHDLANPDQILIGTDNTEAGEKISAIYKSICKSNPAIHLMDRLSAEITKLATNCFLTTKISFANSIGDLAIKAGADPEKILAAIGSDSRIGSKYLNYGFGFGGPCFPRDNRALGYFADQTGYELLISKSTDAVNKQHLEFQVNHWLKKYPENEEIEFDFITYKKDSDLLEASQQLALAVRLAKAGRKVRISERHSVVKQLEIKYPGLFILNIRD